MSLKDKIPNKIPNLSKLGLNKIKVYAFVGPSGTGKSYRAQMVASEKNVNYIIDDGLLIKDNEVIAGESAKKAPTKIETVKHALFYTDEEKQEIPVPTFEIKKDFSGYLLDPLQIFKTKGRGKEPYISEKSIIRPTFSYMGNFTISDTVFRQIIEYLASKTIEIHKVQKIRVDNFGEGVKLYMEVTVVYGFNVVDGINEFKAKAKKEIEKLTAMNVEEFEVVAKNVYIPQGNM